MAEERQFQRKMPAVDREVKDIQATDTRVRVIGTIVDRKEGRIVLDDGTGNIEVSFEGPVEQETGKLVRVFGRVVPSEGGFELQGEIIQPMEGLDLELLKKVREQEQRLKNQGA